MQNPRKSYTEDFKLKVARLVLDGKKTYVGAVREFKVPASVLATWMKRLREDPTRTSISLRKSVGRVIHQEAFNAPVVVKPVEPVEPPKPVANEPTVKELADTIYRLRARIHEVELHKARLGQLVVKLLSGEQV